MGSFLHASAIELVRALIVEMCVGGGGTERERRTTLLHRPAYSEVCGCIGLHEILQSVQITRTKSAQETCFKIFPPTYTGIQLMLFIMTTRQCTE
jgi:hypothetical protein